MDRTTSVMHVVNVIEADLNQLLGSFLQFASLAALPQPWQYHLVIVDRTPEVTRNIADWAEELGMACRVRSAASPISPYMNRWLFLQAYPELSAAQQIAFVDWDVIYTGRAAIPSPPDNRILCRRNPPDMYRHLIRQLGDVLPQTLVTRELDVTSSVNAGVVIGSGSMLHECADRNQYWLEKVFDGVKSGHLTDKDQLAFSLALGEAGWERLSDPWNVTPLSPVADHDVQLWHYNNSVVEMMRLKRRLLEPQFVTATCTAFQQAWPRTMQTFLSLYEQACRSRLFKAFLQASPL